MAKGVYISKALAIATIVLTISAVCGIVLMVILYKVQIDKSPPGYPPTPSPTTPLPTGLPPSLRLPKNLIPESYEIYLHLYTYTVLPNATEQVYDFKGNSTVRFKCVKDTRTIILHAAFLSITHVEVTRSDKQQKIDVKRFEVHNESDFFEIQLKDVLVGNGSYQLFTTFEGELHDDLAGLYVSQYTTNVNGEDEERFLVASQMQPTDARRVFPCFDEPDMKAMFKITIIHRKDTCAHSNTPGRPEIITDNNGEKWAITEFEPTPVMSTYLLAFTVTETDFESKSVKIQEPELKIWARPDAVAAGHTEYALEITEKIFKHYKDTFQLEYPLTKLDQMAVPDFSGSAMENWGLIMYRESALLYEEGVSSASNKEWVATVIAHELAHQWFGNLVTMKWWNNLWLNEGFATFFSYFGVHEAEPQWNIKDLIVLKEIRVAMAVDSLNSSHPLSPPQSEVDNPGQISELFDSISYSKGAAVLRMLYTFIGEKLFMESIREYLKRYQYKNTEKEDLWECFPEKLQGQNLHDVMNTWTEQPGYPVITIDTTDGQYIQERFLINRAEDQGLQWMIPIKAMKKGSKNTTDILIKKGPIHIPNFEVKGDEWLLANLNCTGYYRVNYDEENWYKLIHQLETDHSVIPLLNRGQLIDDAFNLARAKYINVTLALSTTKFLINDTDYVPWESALSNLRYFMLMFDRSEVYGPMQKYLRNQIEPLYDRFKEYTENMTVPEDIANQYNQINAITVACSTGLPDCTEMAISLFKEWRNGINRIPGNLKSIIYCNAIAAGDEDDWEFAWEQYENATISTEKDKLRYGLSCTKKVWLLNRYLEYTLDHNKIRKMDGASTISYIARNVVGQALAWDFIRAHWKYVSQEYGIIFDDFLIDEVTQRFSTDFELQQLRDFRQMCSEDGSCADKRTLDLVIERTQANIKWVKENKQTVLNWFVEQAKQL
ncbi:alanyl (membrane) aminopeptidase-like b [Brachyhypopomus gauderio]|uniref:alanyl (membrane) aminopeptidase-like b n=1 Tax=Brachyhypopomus gauderio TaxID=698409 RepID=UPI004042DE29